MTHFWGGYETNLKNKSSYFSAFTLAEMMVVMLILSIVLAAMAPVMTTRNKPNNSSPWKYEANNRNNAWFGAGTDQKAMIGKMTYENSYDKAKLLIATNSDDMNMLAFMKTNTNLGRLYMSSDQLLLGNLSSGNLGSGAVVIGRNLQAGTNSTGLGSTVVATGNNSTAVGSTVTASGANSIAIGTSTTASGSNSIGIGNNADPCDSDTIAIGHNATTTKKTSDGLDVQGAIAVGSSSNAKYSNSIAIGSGAVSGGYLITDSANLVGESIAIGHRANTTGPNSISIGASSVANGNYSVAIGQASSSTGGLSVALGRSTSATKPHTIAIGNSAVALTTGGLAIGRNAKVESVSTTESSASAIAIGIEAYANKYVASDKTYSGSLAIGDNAKATYGGIAIGMKNGYISNPGAPSVTITPTRTEAVQNSIAIGNNAKATYFDTIAIGDNAKATNTGNIAIGTNACSGVSGTHKICIGANSGPSSSDPWATDHEERVFIGSRSKYNGGPAVLEVHNNALQQFSLNNNNAKLANSVVVINGALLVKGGIIASMSWADDGQIVSDDGNAGYANMIGRTGQQLERLDLTGWEEGRNDVENEFGSSIHGQFLAPLNGRPVASDRRLKYVGKENTSGLDKIRQLKIFNYTYKKDTTKTPHVGVIAQDLQKVFPNAVKKGADGFLTIRMEDMFYAVINAIKELDAKYQAQEKRITALEKENKEFKARLERLEAKTR